MFLYIAELGYLIFCENFHICMYFSQCYKYHNIKPLLLTLLFKGQGIECVKKKRKTKVILPQSHFSFPLVAVVSMHVYHIFMCL